MQEGRGKKRRRGRGARISKGHWRSDRQLTDHLHGVQTQLHVDENHEELVELSHRPQPLKQRNRESRIVLNQVRKPLRRESAV